MQGGSSPKSSHIRVSRFMQVHMHDSVDNNSFRVAQRLPEVNQHCRLFNVVDIVLRCVWELKRSVRVDGIRVPTVDGLIPPIQQVLYMCEHKIFDIAENDSQ
mgnify:CR=1 FL=1